MNTWYDLIARWGGPKAFSLSLGVSHDAAKQMASRNRVHSDYWALIVARAPSAGVQGVTLELLASLQSGHANKPGRRDDRFRRPAPAQIMSVVANELVSGRVGKEKSPGAWDQPWRGISDYTRGHLCQQDQAPSSAIFT